MNYNDHFQSKITLLNQYALCLEKENQSKNKQISTLHHHLQLISHQNQTLRQQIHETNLKNNSNQSGFEDASDQKSDSFTSTGQNKETIQCCSQTQGIWEQDQYEYEDQTKKLKEIIIYKQQKLQKYQSECQQMYEAIEKLERELVEQESKNNKYHEKILALEEMLKSQEQKRIATQKYLQSMANSLGNTDQTNNQLTEQYYEMKINLQQLIIENNMLIQRSRELQKQKNDYYHQLKSQIKIKSVNQYEGKKSIKRESKIKDQRWRQIETNLQKLQLQNEAMQSNLMIRR